MSSSITNRHPQNVRTRNIALFSIFAVISGSWMLFRAQSPNKNDVLVSKEDKQTVLRGQGLTGGKVARSSEHQDQD